MIDLLQNFDNCSAPTFIFFLKKAPPFKKGGGLQKLWFVSAPLVHVEHKISPLYPAILRFCATSIAFVTSILVLMWKEQGGIKEAHAFL